jgi:hypothetical protein
VRQGFGAGVRIAARIGLVLNSPVPYFLAIVTHFSVPINAHAETKAEIHPRYLVELSPELLDTLNRLAKRSGESGNVKDVIQKAIALFDVATRATDEGRKIGIFDQDRKLITEIVDI